MRWLLLCSLALGLAACMPKRDDWSGAPDDPNAPRFYEIIYCLGFPGECSKEGYVE